MSKEKAKAYYADKARNKFNCGQAVVAAFREKFSLGEDVVGLFASYGAGKAPEGVCGAYYAVKFILKDKHPDKASKCEEIFLAKAGSTKCKEIRQLKKLPCAGCVEIVAEFLDGIIL